MQRFLSLIIPIGLLLAWWLTTTYGHIPAILLPSPEAVWLAFVNLWQSGDLWTHIGMSAMRTLTGFLLATVGRYWVWCVVCGAPNGWLDRAFGG